MLEISVIIPTRNRCELLDANLNALAEQTLSNECFEVIIVDNKSGDNTKAVADKYSKAFPHYKYCFEKQTGLHNCRHRGMREASTEILTFCDDDIEAFPGWLTAISESFQDPDTVLVGGKNLPSFEVPPPYWIYEKWMEIKDVGRYMGYLSILDFGENLKEIDPAFVWGCNFSIRKKVLIAAGGFHPDSLPQELVKYRGDGESYVGEYIRSNKLKAIYNPKASVYHYVGKERMTLDYFCRRAFNQGISDSYTDIRRKRG